MPRWAIILAAVIIAGGVFLSYFGLGTRGDDKQQVEAVIADVQHAASARDWGRVLSHISPDYRDKGGMSKDALRGLAAQATSLEKPFQLQATVQGVTVSDKNRATALVRVTVAHAEGGAQALDVMVVFEKKGNWWQNFTGHGWQVTDAEGWQPALGTGE